MLELRHNPDATVHRETGILPPPELAGSDRGGSVKQLASFLQSQQAPVLLCAESAGRREILLESLHAEQLTPPEVANWSDFIASKLPFAIATAPIDRGLYSGRDAPSLICESQLFGRRVAQRRRRKRVMTLPRPLPSRISTNSARGYPWCTLSTA